MFFPFLKYSIVVFDPVAFYGHHELDLAIGGMGICADFDTEFYQAYHKLIPRAPGFYQRQELYRLFQYLMHWYVHVLLYRVAPKKRNSRYSRFFRTLL